MKRPKERPVKRADVAARMLAWYSRKGRVLPWRTTRHPYRILLSEIMLQQTQVSRVLQKYPAFLRQFPTLSSLARAPLRDVVVAWRGLGYNNRAVRLHRLACEVMEHHGGKIPGRLDALLAFPGIGKYTAHALLASAFGEEVPAVDVNARRVLSRCLWPMRTSRAVMSEREVWRRAAELLPRGRAYEWNQALMDVGATVCTARKPSCGICPVRTLCASRPIMRPSPREIRTREKLYDGLPNRLYRGRIIELLRGERRGMTPRRLGTMVRTGFASRHHPWMRSLLGALQRDGLITIMGNGTFMARRVSLP